MLSSNPARGLGSVVKGVARNDQIRLVSPDGASRVGFDASE